MTELDPTVREFVDRVARKVLESADFSEPLEGTIEQIGERTYRVIFHRGDEIKRLRVYEKIYADARTEIDRLHRILAALRKPSEGMLDVVVTAAWIKRMALVQKRVADSMIRAAVEAAEQEVGG